MNWYIGQKVVAVLDMRDKLKKGATYTIKGLRKPICKHSGVLIDVGINDPVRSVAHTAHCPVCGKKSGDLIVMWFAERCFAPIEPKQELSEHTTETLIEELEEQLQPR